MGLQEKLKKNYVKPFKYKAPVKIGRGFSLFIPGFEIYYFIYSKK